MAVAQCSVFGEASGASRAQQVTHSAASHLAVEPPAAPTGGRPARLAVKQRQGYKGVRMAAEYTQRQGLLGDEGRNETN